MGFAVKNTLLAMTFPPSGGSERILSIHPSTSNGPANLLSVYAPTLCTLREARSEAQQMARRCANNYWLELSANIQAASDTGNIRGMYEGIKQANGPSIKKTAPLGEVG